MLKKILCVFGTRPEAIKMVPVVKELLRHTDNFCPVVCVTAQHREMLDQVLSVFDIKPDIDLNLMEENQSLDSLTAKAMRMLTGVLLKVKPDIVLVQGDTTTAMVAALAAFYQKIPVGHIEAGLRTNDKYNPFPEEANRRLISALATYHFTPTKNATQALLREGVRKDSIFLTGNTVVDALHMIIKKDYQPNTVYLSNNGDKLILVTAHRRENFGEPLKNICMALSQIAKRNQNVKIVYPVHMNPNVQKVVYEILGQEERIRLIPPVGYLELIHLLNESYLVLTDSGGIQEEAPALGKPVLVLRKETERPEGIEARVAKLVGTDTEKIVRQTEILLNNKKEYLNMAKAISPYGDGHAAEKIVTCLKTHISG